MIIRNIYSKNLLTKEFEKNSLPSKTIPNQAMSIPELMHRYTQGLPLGGSKVPSYSENPEEDILGGVDWRTLDISEQHEIVKSVGNEIQDIKKRKYTSKKSNESDNTSKNPTNNPTE